MNYIGALFARPLARRPLPFGPRELVLLERLAARGARLRHRGTCGLCCLTSLRWQKKCASDCEPRLNLATWYFIRTDSRPPPKPCTLRGTWDLRVGLSVSGHIWVPYSARWPPRPMRLQRVLTRPHTPPMEQSTPVQTQPQKKFYHELFDRTVLEPLFCIRTVGGGLLYSRGGYGVE